MKNYQTGSHQTANITHSLDHISTVVSIYGVGCKILTYANAKILLEYPWTRIMIDISSKLKGFTASQTSHAQKKFISICQQFLLLNL